MEEEASVTWALSLKAEKAKDLHALVMQVKEQSEKWCYKEDQINENRTALAMKIAK